MGYEGKLIWSNGDRATVRDAIVDRDRITFDAQYPAGTYRVVLTPHPESEQWVGTWTSKGRSNKVNTRVKTDGGVVELRGRWLDCEDYGWELDLFLE